jgi:hypothetical protein
MLGQVDLGLELAGGAPAADAHLVAGEPDPPLPGKRREGNVRAALVAY